MERLRLSEYRYFDPDPEIRKLAYALYEEVRGLPLVCPHGHVDPRLLAEDEPFPEPATLLIVPDHYIFRMLYSRGIALEELGITHGNGPLAADPRRVWRRFAENYILFAGTPTGAWLDYQLHHVFGIQYKLTGESADYIYDEILEKLRSPEFRPRALFERFNIEVLTTTDDASDALVWHRAIRDSGWHGRVIPCFWPDGLLAIAAPDWLARLAAFEGVAGTRVRSYEDFLGALAARRMFFQSLGCVSTDHAVLEPYTAVLPAAEAEAIFGRALGGRATAADERRLQAHMLMEMARLSTEDGLVMQIRAGAFRDHNPVVFERFGPDKGADIPVATEFTRNLKALLNAYGNNPAFTLVVFTVDESTYSRELAPLAGHYPALRLGPPWWFLDSIEGITRYRQLVMETAGLHNTAGFNDDARAFTSIPARHDLARRVDANYVARLVARQIIDMSDARAMMRAMAYDLARSTYKLDAAAVPG